MIRTSDEWVEKYKENGALWIHGGNPNQPHALLTSGMHSNGFFNSRLVTEDNRLLSEAVQDLLRLFREQGGDVSKVQGCIGPQTGATKLAKVGSEWINDDKLRPWCFWASPAKHEKDGKKSMIFSDRDRAILSGQSVLPWEDVSTTGGSVDMMVKAVERIGGIVLPYVLVLVNRSGLQSVNGRRVVALIKHDMPIQSADKCILCKAGSEALRPKDNWDRLNAVY